MRIRSVSNHLRVLRRAGQTGLSLIELMVALAISLVVLFAVTNLFLTTTASTRTQAGISRINENSQISAELLAREIRQVAHMGCPALGDVSRGFRRLSRDSIDATGASNTFTMGPTNAVQLLASTVESNAIAGTTVIDVVHAATAGAHLVAPMTSRNADMLLRGDSGVRMPTSLTSTNSYPTALISDCATAEVFQVLAVSSNPWSISPFAALRTTYTSDARVMPVTRTRFYIGNFTRPSDENSTRAIYRKSMRADGYNWDVAQPIVHDVQSMTLSVELDTDGDYQADTTVLSTSAFDPALVVGLTMDIVFNTPTRVRGTGGAVITRTSTATIGLRARST